MGNDAIYLGPLPMKIQGWTGHFSTFLGVKDSIKKAVGTSSKVETRR